MPYKEKEIEKLYYTIGEVAQMFNVNTSHIRFWSKEFDVIRPATNKKGNRLYTQSDIDNFRKIYHLVKEKGYTLKGAKSELKEMKQPSVASGPPATEELFPEVLPFDNPVDVPLSSSGDFQEDIVNRMAIKNNLEKVHSSLREVEKELDGLLKE